MSATRRRWGWFLVLALVAVALVRAGVDGPSPRSESERVRDIAATMKCPVCAGQSVAESDVEAARAIREEISRRVDDGQADDEIRDAIAASYGDRIQLTPGRSGFEGLVWILPVVALVLASAGIASAFARWRRTAVVTASEADKALVERALAEQQDDP
ncbi:MAG: cytochrome c-type biogenesis protein CcmH [Actinomycetota bacterium]|nr:cytochrome c-type biogenesis protein CcmH [Actinomycetota bacterium]